jgi:predicted SprT family Zn-dependent metalloprotease
VNPDHALRQARGLMDQHGLQHWEVGFSRGKNVFGETRIMQRKIVISKSHITLNKWPEVQEVILHEIAHALVEEKYGNTVKAHGPEWKAMAHSIGAQQLSARMKGAVTPEARYRGVCKCGIPHARHRLAARAVTSYVCVQCRGPVQWTDTKLGKALP